ncbi:CHAT domain-containing protein, partial [Stigmatella aurantiaca]|uniref:CHAT domain-containing protein n=1 Tax=Stigmatella aurantiaca TaxID=41 RepID=UPI0011604052
VGPSDALKCLRTLQLSVGPHPVIPPPVIDPGYGLRRSLMVAGAETLLISLWKVNDNSTHLLMDLYYRNLLKGLGRASALREAMLALRTTHPHPHAWAPFIALGSAAPLRSMTPIPPQTPKPEDSH